MPDATYGDMITGPSIMVQITQHSQLGFMLSNFKSQKQMTG